MMDYKKILLLCLSYIAINASQEYKGWYGDQFEHNQDGSEQSEFLDNYFAQQLLDAHDWQAKKRFPDKPQAQAHELFKIVAADELSKYPYKLKGNPKKRYRKYLVLIQNAQSQK